MNEMNIETTDFKTVFSLVTKLEFMASLGLLKKEQIKKIVEDRRIGDWRKSLRATRSGLVYNNFSSMATEVAENISCYKTTTKAKEKTNEKIRNKQLIQQNFEESEVEQQQIKNIKTNVKKQSKTKPESLKLKAQKSITYKPIASTMNEVNETIAFKIISPQRKLKSIAGPGLLTKEQSKEENEKVKSMLHKKNEIHLKVTILANEDNTKQTNHDQSSSDTTHLIIPKLYLWTPYDKIIKLQMVLTMNLVKHGCIPMTYDLTVTDVLDLKWTNELEYINLLNKKLEKIQSQLRGIQKNHNSSLQKIGVSKYQSIVYKNINLNRFLNWISRKFKKMKISIIRNKEIELNKYCDDKIRAIENKKPKAKELENITFTEHENMHFKSRRKKRLLKCISLQAPLMAITAPIEKTLSTAVLSMKKEDDKSTATTALIFNKNIQSKCLDEHSTAPRINMIQAFQKLKESFPKNKCFITELIMLERYRNMGDLVIKNIDHE